MAEKGGRMDVGHCSRIRHAERGAETSGGEWWVAGVAKFQVDDVPIQERK